MPVYKLTYFDVRARAELARLLFAYLGQEYENVVFCQEDWWFKVRPTTPFGKVPTLEIDGKVYTESVAINNYLASECGLYGKTAIDRLEIDQVIGKTQDVWVYIIEWVHAILNDREGQSGAVEALEKQNLEIHFPKYLETFEKILTANGTGFYVGKEMTYADIAVFDLLDIEFPDWLLEKYPKVKANRDIVRNHPKLKTYIDNRKTSRW